MSENNFVEKLLKGYVPLTEEQALEQGVIENKDDYLSYLVDSSYMHFTHDKDGK